MEPKATSRSGVRHSIGALITRANEFAHATPVCGSGGCARGSAGMGRRSTVGSWMWLALAVVPALVCGCPGAGGTTDPPSDAPEFAGQWQLRGAGGRDTGCLLADETGDPVSLTGNPEIARAVDESVIFFDGAPRTTSSGLLYTAIARTSIINEDVLVVFDIDVFQLGIDVGTQHFELDGVLVDEDNVVGTFESRQEAAFVDVPPLVTEEGTAERGGCL